MAGYYVNKKPQRNGDHEVHQDSCTFLPRNNTYLGNFSSCAPAVLAARRIYERANGCAVCSKECHTASAPDARPSTIRR